MVPSSHGVAPQTCPRQNRSQRSAQPPRTIAHEMSPLTGDRHQAAVRVPPAPPSETQLSVGPLTRMCPSALRPIGVPTSATSASRASIALASGHGWLALQLPSISRAAIPVSRTWGPSAHQIGPSPSHTRVGVQLNDWPEGTIAAAASKTAIIGHRTARSPRRPDLGPNARHNRAVRDKRAQLPLPLPLCSFYKLRQQEYRASVEDCEVRLSDLVQARGGNDSRQSFGCCDNLRYSSHRHAQTMPRGLGG